MDLLWNYIADASLENADIFVDELHETMQKLCRHPGMGRLREELAPRIQSFRTGAMLFFVVKIQVRSWSFAFSTAQATLRAVLSETRPTLVQISKFDRFSRRFIDCLVCGWPGFSDICATHRASWPCA
jgi:hypothetical protein